MRTSCLPIALNAAAHYTHDNDDKVTATNNNDDDDDGNDYDVK